MIDPCGIGTLGDPFMPGPDVGVDRTDRHNGAGKPIDGHRLSGGATLRVFMPKRNLVGRVRRTARS